MAHNLVLMVSGFELSDGVFFANIKKSESVVSKTYLCKGVLGEIEVGESFASKLTSICEDFFEYDCFDAGCEEVVDDIQFISDNLDFAVESNLEGNIDFDSPYEIYIIDDPKSKKYIEVKLIIGEGV